MKGNLLFMDPVLGPRTGAALCFCCWWGWWWAEENRWNYWSQLVNWVGKRYFRNSLKPVYTRQYHLQQISFAEQPFHPKYEPRSFVNTSRNTSHAFSLFFFLTKTIALFLLIYLFQFPLKFFKVPKLSKFHGSAQRFLGIWKLM